MNHQRDMRARLFRERNPAAFGVLTDTNPPVLAKVPATITEEEAVRIANKVLTVGQEESSAAEALARAGKTAEAIEAFGRLRVEYRGSWIDRVAAQRIEKLQGAVGDSPRWVGCFAYAPSQPWRILPSLHTRAPSAPCSGSAPAHAKKPCAGLDGEGHGVGLGFRADILPRIGEIQVEMDLLPPPSSRPRNRGREGDAGASAPGYSRAIPRTNPRRSGTPR
jgi:hypothetical protein